MTSNKETPDLVQLIKGRTRSGVSLFYRDLSAMLIAMIPTYFLMKRCRSAYIDLIAPISIVVIYGFIAQNYGNLDVGDQIVGYAAVFFLFIIKKVFTFSDLDSTEGLTMDILFYIPLLCAIILLGLVDQTPISRFLNTHLAKTWRYLGKLSIYIYLFHWGVFLINFQWEKFYKEIAIGTSIGLPIACPIGTFLEVNPK